MQAVAVVIPTKNRPEKLRRCLSALEAAIARSRVERVWVCDSSTTEDLRARVAAVCSPFPWVRLTYHTGANVAAARNTCARTATQDIIINVDDDVYVEPGALAALVDAYDRTGGPCAIAGSVAWNDVWSRPVVMRPIGYGRFARPGEAPSFLVGAFFLYPRAFALTWPWNERIRTSDDRFMGALWRSRGVRLLFEPEARAAHDSQHTAYNARDHHDHIYTNLYDTLVANPHVLRALSYEFVGFAFGLRRFWGSPAKMRDFAKAWLEGNRDFLRDRAFLAGLTAAPIPPACASRMAAALEPASN